MNVELLSDTIAAIASPPGGAWRGILRVSGEQCADCLEACLTPDLMATHSLRALRVATVLTSRLRLPSPLGDLPAEIYFWPTERSYTRQPCAEIHTIGSPPLLAAALAALLSAGARLAQPGEFTLRAFLAGRIDLTQAEAVLGVIDARGEQDLRIALSQLAGGLADPLNQLRDRLLNLLAHLEAGLDFVDEDIEFISPAALQAELRIAADAVRALSEQFQSRGDSGAAPRVALVGLPNAGKSSLLNALVGESAAIVSPQPGTTRDYVARRIALAGVSCELVDTAGVDHAAGGMEAAAQRLGAGQAEQAQLQLLCLDASRELLPWEVAQLRPPRPANVILALTKCDAAIAFHGPPDALRTSSQTGQGINELRQAIAGRLQNIEDVGVASGASARCQESLAQAAAGLKRAESAAIARVGEEIVAAEIRAALDDLGRVVGAVYTDDVLDRIFSRFCIGK